MADSGRTESRFVRTHPSSSPAFVGQVENEHVRRLAGGSSRLRRRRKRQRGALHRGCAALRHPQQLPAGLPPRSSMPPPQHCRGRRRRPSWRQAVPSPPPDGEAVAGALRPGLGTVRCPEGPVRPAQYPGPGPGNFPQDCYPFSPPALLSVTPTSLFYDEKGGLGEMMPIRWCSFSCFL